MDRIWVKTALFNFLIAAGLGALLRFAFVEEVPGMNYRYWLHAHSHVAMLGWVYLALYALLIPAFLTGEQARRPLYQRLFRLTQLSVLGMLFSFPVQGYGPVSIAFSTLHALLSYAFVYYFLRDLRQRPQFLSIRFARSALFFLLFSTLGLWVLAPVMAGGGKGSTWYFLSVQFFLHFQFFGWFLFAVFALLFKRMESERLALPARPARLLYGLLLAGTLLTFALPATWANDAPLLFAANGLGALLQVAAAFVLWRLLRAPWRAWSRLLPAGAKTFFLTALAAFVLKALLQGITLLPSVAVISYTIRNFMIGYVHLFLLGVVSCFLLGWMWDKGIFHAGILRRAGAGLFLAGLFASEFLLFFQGLLLWTGMGFLPAYYPLLFGLSAAMTAGVLLLFGAALRSGQR